MTRSIYLDHAATTPVAPEVAEAIRPFLAERFGNPSSIHRLGREARTAVDAARDSIAAALHCDYSEITFTSSGTEADNLALFGAMLAARPDRNHMVISAVEHHAVLHAARALDTQGYGVTVLGVDREGRVDLQRLEQAVTDQTCLVSIMHANNEIGTIQDAARIARIVHERSALFHTDAVQTFGSLPLNTRGIGCDMLTVSAHKLYGPKGVGALYVRTGVALSPMIVGGAQERERRAGTENVPGIVGFGAAVELAERLRESESARLIALRDHFIAALFEAVPDLILNGPSTGRLPNNVNVSIRGIDGAAVLMSLDRAGIAASSGSACSSGSIEPSHVLKAIGLTPDLAASGIRFTLGRSTTESELDETAAVLADILDRMRS